MKTPVKKILETGLDNLFEIYYNKTVTKAAMQSMMQSILFRILRRRHVWKSGVEAAASSSVYRMTR